MYINTDIFIYSKLQFPALNIYQIHKYCTILDRVLCHTLWSP